MLFLRLGRFLSEQGHQVALVDYKDGFMASHCPPQVELIEYRDDSVVELPSDAVAVFQAMTPWSIFPALWLHRSNRLLFWSCHPFNLVPTLPGVRRFMHFSPSFAQLILNTLLRSYLGTMRRFVGMLESKRSLVFMDSANVETPRRYLGLPLSQPMLLPIPVAVGQAVSSNRIRSRLQGIRLVWVGRLVDFKYNVLDFTLSQLDRVQPSLNLPMTVTVVGTGEFANRLQKRAAGLRNLAISFVDYVAPQVLDDFLLAEADVLLAMGTSALEGAKLGVPTLLLDVAYCRVPDGYVFRWLDESRGYSLGDVLSAERLIPGNDSLAKCLGQVLSGYPELSERMRNYFRRNHAIEVVADRFVALASSAKCTWGDLADLGLIRRDVVRSAYDTLRKFLRR